MTCVIHRLVWCTGCVVHRTPVCQSLASLLPMHVTQRRTPCGSRVTQAPALRKASVACRAPHLFHTPCGWNLHKVVDNYLQAPACNAVKMGGEKMTSRS